MNNIHILDCTLRDGGYCNAWRFGFENTKRIIKGLIDADIEIIECGFITNKTKHDSNTTQFNTLDEIAKVIPTNRNGKIFVAMMNYNEFDIDTLPDYDGSSIDGIRLAFHKTNRYEAIKVCERIKSKGYLVFIQAMVSLSYKDSEFLEMIHMANEIDPYAFYIVDSFGMMKSKDLSRLFYMVEHNLRPDIWIGFHSHNNMQLAYSNAQHLTNVHTNRNLIIDSSVYGMGRGAGNLNTELFVDYLNENYNKNYQLKPLLNLIDEILNEFYQQNYWGYSLPNYISAVHNAHPNYANYLDDKKTLTIEDINEIFDQMADDKKVAFDKNYIEELYLKFMAREKAQENHTNELIDYISGRPILLIAPGKSSVEEADKIKEFIKNNDVVVISINHAYSFWIPDFIFLSNLRRFREIDQKEISKCIVTSNIPSDGVYIHTKYKDLLNSEETVTDNAGLMAVKFFSNLGVDNIFLAGFDGYSHDLKENYGVSEMAFATRNDVLDAMNVGMSKILTEYSSNLNICFLTTPKHVNIKLST